MTDYPMPQILQVERDKEGNLVAIMVLDRDVPVTLRVPMRVESA